MIEAKGRWVFILPKEQTNRYGIYMSDDALGAPTEGEVVSCGPDCVGTKAGDTILFSKGGKEVEHEGKTYIILNEADIYAKI